MAHEDYSNPRRKVLIEECMEAWRQYAQGWRIMAHELTFYEDLNSRFNLAEPAFRSSKRLGNTLDNYPIDIDLFRYVDEISAREYLGDLSYTELIMLRRRIENDIVLGYVFRSVREWIPCIKYAYSLRCRRAEEIRKAFAEE